MAYTECAEGELGMLLAERLAQLGLQPFNRATVNEANRRIEVFVHHFRLMLKALTGPLRPLSRATRVLVAMCGASEREDFFSELLSTAPGQADPQRVRAFYGTSVVDELHCAGSHLEVAVRCATNREPTFTASWVRFLRTLETKRAANAGGSEW